MSGSTIVPICQKGRRRSRKGRPHRGLHDIIKDMVFVACKDHNCAISQSAMQTLEVSVGYFAQTLLSFRHRD